MIPLETVLKQVTLLCLEIFFLETMANHEEALVLGVGNSK
jgi:hypothetical protein